MAASIPMRPAQTTSLLIFLLCSAFFAWVGQHRVVALDEGFYVLQAKQVLEGMVPYRDFFFPQMPYLPALQAAWFSLAGISWVSARMLSAIFSALTALLLGEILRRKFGTWAAAAGLALFLTSDAVLIWYSPVKTYAPSALLLLSIYSLLESWCTREKDGDTLLPAFIGLALGLLVGIRLYLGAIVVVVVAHALFSKRRPTAREARLFVLGGLAASLPFLLNMFVAWDQFWFDNLGLHLARSKVSSGERWEQKLRVVEILFGFAPGVRFVGGQFALLYLGVAIGVTLTFVKRRSVTLASSFVLVLTAVSALPAPLYTQYFCVVVPFLILANVELAISLAREVKLPRLVPALAAIFIASYAWTTPENFARFSTPPNPPRTRTEKGNSPWTLSAIREVNRAVADLTPGGANVISLWPGYILETKLTPIGGSENHFAALAATILPEKDHRRYSILSNANRERLIRRGVPDFVISGRYRRLRTQKSGLRRGGYVLVREVAGVEIYRRDRSTGRSE